MAVINIPKALRERLTEEGAEAFVQILEKMEKHTENAVLHAAEGRFEKRLVEVKSELEIKIEQVRADLETKIERVRSDLIQWMFVFWVGQIGVMTGILFAFFRK